MHNIPMYQNWNLSLTGTNISITPISPSDLEPYSRLMFGSFFDQENSFLGRLAASDFVKILSHQSEDEMHAIRPVDSDKFIGWIILQNDDNLPDIGISLIDEYQNKGYGPEAIKLYSNWLHEEYGLSEVYARISEDNLQSQRAFSKIGAVKYRSGKNQIAEKLDALLPGTRSGDTKRSDTGFYKIHLPIV